MRKKPTPLHVVQDGRTAVRGPGGVIRQDGWKNLVTLLGTSLDKRTASHLTWEYRDPEFFEQLYSGGGIPARIVDLVPNEACRRWVDWIDMEETEEEKVEARCQELDLRGAFMRSWIWGRAFGGGLLHIVTDTKDPGSPLRDGERVLALRDLSRWDVRVLTTDIEYDFGSPNFGHPRLYYLNVQMGSQYKGYPIHWSRMIRFDGQLVPRRTFIRNNYWHDSVLNRIYDTMRDYQTSNDAAAACLQDFNVDVMSMKNLANMVGAGKEQMVQRRMKVIQYAKSVLNMVLLDADSETYENKARSMEGIAELLQHQANRLVAETDIPHTKLLGESPDGSNATGNSTSQQWDNFIQSEQANYALPKLRRLIDIIFPGSKPKFRFRTLRVLDDVEETELHLKQAQADQIYLEAGVVDPTEISKSRFGGKEYSIETELDQEARDAGLFGLNGPEQAASAAALAPGQDDPNGDEGDDDGGDDNGGGGKSGGKKPNPFQKKDAGQEGHEQEALAYAPRDVELAMPNGKKVVSKTDPIISQMMSEPMRDPLTDPHMKGPGTPNQPRTFMPTTGDGVVAQSGAKAGEPVQDIPLRPEGQHADFEESKHPRGESGQFGSGGSGGKGPDYHMKSMQQAQQRETLAASRVKQHQAENGQKAGWWSTPEYTDLASEYKSAVRYRQKAEREAKSFVASQKKVDADGKWITMNESRVKINGKGEVAGGPAAGTKLPNAEHKSLGELSKSKSAAPTSEPASSASNESQKKEAPKTSASKSDPTSVSSKAAPQQNGTVNGGLKHEEHDFASIVHELKGLHLTDGMMKNWIANPEGSTSPQKVVVLRENGKIIGWAGVGNIRVNRNFEQMMSVYVDPSARGKGAGKKLVTEATKGADLDNPIYYATDKPHVRKMIEEGGGEAVEAPKSLFVEDSADSTKDKTSRASKVIVRDGDKFLMGKRRDNGRWTFPGGHAEDNESHHQAGVRELDEETGLQAKRLKFLGARMVEPKQGESVHVNLYQHHMDKDGKPSFKNDPDKEFDEFRWLSSKGKLPEDISGNLHHPNDVALQHLGLLK